MQMLPKFDGIEVICNQWKESRQFEWRFVQVFKPHLWRQLQEMQLMVSGGDRHEITRTAESTSSFHWED